MTSAGENPQKAETNKLIQATQTLCGQLTEILKTMNQVKLPQTPTNTQSMSDPSQQNTYQIAQQRAQYPVYIRCGAKIPCHRLGTFCHKANILHSNTLTGTGHQAAT